MVTGGACFIHALFPGLCVSTASNKIRSLAAQIENRLDSVQSSDAAIANPTGDYPVPMMMAEKHPN